MQGDFLDTNVLAYLASADLARADIAEKIARNGGGISVQVLNELANVACRKMRLSWAETHALLAMIRGLLAIHPVTVEIHEAGLGHAERYGLSNYDAMIAASALRAGCDRLWTEDMQDGMTIEGRLVLRNPFRAAA